MTLCGMYANAIGSTVITDDVANAGVTFLVIFILAFIVGGIRYWLQRRK